MQQYLTLLDKLLNEGNVKGDRTGTGTRSIFGYQMRFNLQEGFPLVTTKRIHLKSVIHELLWLLRGDTNIKYLVDNGVSIWTDWPLKKFNQERTLFGKEPWTQEEFENSIRNDLQFAVKWGDLGPVYGKQWRKWEGDVIDAQVNFTHRDEDKMHGVVNYTRQEFDQISETLELIKNDPNSRRMVVSAWNPGDADKVALHWCHCMFQFYVHDGKLSCQLYQRSCDTFLGLPFNIASYAFLTHMMAQQAGLEFGELVWTGGDVHLYNNHVEQAREQLSRVPYPSPTLVLNKAPSIFEYMIEDFVIDGYQFHPAIKAPVAV